MLWPVVVAVVAPLQQLILQTRQAPAAAAVAAYALEAEALPEQH
jgi:hypothetical protein